MNIVIGRIIYRVMGDKIVRFNILADCQMLNGKIVSIFNDFHTFSIYGYFNPDLLPYDILDAIMI